MSVILPSITMATISTGFLTTFRLVVMNLARQSACTPIRALPLASSDPSAR